MICRYHILPVCTSIPRISRHLYFKREAINTHRTDVTENCGKLTNVNNSQTREPMSPRIAENQRMSTPNKKFVKSMIILGCNWLTVSKIKKQRLKFGFLGVLWLEGEDAKKEVILVYSLVIC